MSEWYYTKGGQRHGPVGTETLNQLAASGILEASDLVWRDGMADWIAASSMEPLAKVIAGRVPQPPPTSPRSPQSTPPSPNEGVLSGQETLATFAALAKQAKAAGRAAAAKARQANAAIPSSIKVGNRSVPKGIVIGGAAVLLIVLAWLLLGGTPSVSATKLQAAYGGLELDKGGPYDGKFLQVEGKVASAVYYDPSNSVAPDRTHVSLQTDTEQEVVCIFQGHVSGGLELQQLTRGDQISVKGKCVGRNMMGGVVVEECELTAGPAQK